MKLLWRLPRAAWRLLLLAGVFLGAAGSFFIVAGRRASLRQRTLWLSRWCTRALRATAVQVRVQGQPPPNRGAVVSNHISYLDILVFSSVNAQVFLAKSEVRRWPVIGKFTEWSGARFIERTQRSDVPRQNNHLRDIVAEEAVPTLFLEGTTTDGRDVLPFFSPLLEPFVERGWLVTPAAIHYTCEGGDPALHVCWWGDMTFIPHLLRMTLLDSITAYLVFGSSMVATGDRKVLAVQLREQVVALKAVLEQSAAPALTV